MVEDRLAAAYTVAGGHLGSLDEESLAGPSWLLPFAFQSPTAVLQRKIADLDRELKGYKDKLKAARTPAAKQNLQKRAMDVLKRKRMYESQRDMAAGQQFNIDQAQFGIESAKATVQTVAAMKSANNEMKRVMKQDLNIDAVEDIADDMAEMLADFNEINEALGNNYATPDLDEADLDAVSSTVCSSSVVEFAQLTLDFFQELEMLAEDFDELEVEEAIPSYLQGPLPAHPTDVPGSKLPGEEDEYGLPVAPQRN